MPELSYGDADRRTIRIAGADGRASFVPVDPANADYARLVERGGEVAPFRLWNGLAAAKAALVAAVKVEAHRRILAHAPEWRQRNALAHAVTMMRKVQLGGALTAEETAAEASYQALWALVRAVRDASDSKEAEVAALPDEAAAEAYDVQAGWPAP